MQQEIMPSHVPAVVFNRIGNEIVAMQTFRNEAHSLNETAAFVFEQCDGKTEMTEVFATTERRFGLSSELAELLVREVLTQLRELGLVTKFSGKRIARRELLKKFGTAAILLPVVSTVLAPTAAAALSPCFTCSGPIALRDPYATSCGKVCKPPCVGNVCAKELVFHNDGSGIGESGDCAGDIAFNGDGCSNFDCRSTGALGVAGRYAVDCAAARTLLFGLALGDPAVADGAHYFCCFCNGAGCP